MALIHYQYLPRLILNLTHGEQDNGDDLQATKAWEIRWKRHKKKAKHTKKAIGSFLHKGHHDFSQILTQIIHFTARVKTTYI
jgi:hypothetical protein